MGTLNRSVWLSLILFLYTVTSIGEEEETRLTDRFLMECGFWSGDFTNYVHQKEGLIQQGKIRLKVNVDSDGVIKQSIALMKPDGTLGDYEGHSSLKVQGDKLKWVGVVREDENTGNPIENHEFIGYIGRNQIYAVEEYEEVYPDGRREKRRNNLHYVFLNEDKVLWLADIYVDDRLLVFANTILEREK